MKINARGTSIVMLPIEPPSEAELKKAGKMLMSEEERVHWRSRAQGLVLSVGPHVNDDPLEETIVEGDILAFNGSKCCLMEGYDRRTLFVVDAENILGVVTEDKPATAEDLKKLSEQNARLREEGEAKKRRAQLHQDAGTAAQASAAGVKLVE